MQAVRLHSFGGPEVLVLEEVPRPQIGAGEVLIRVHAAGVNPLDWKARAGHVKAWLPHRLPLIPGWEVSGVVEEVASDVNVFKVGDSVYGMLDFMRDGAYAEFVTTRTLNLALKPNSIDYTRAAAVPLASLTAWQCLFYRNIKFEKAVHGADVVLDTIGGETQQRSWQLLSKGGILVATLDISSPETATSHGVRGEGVMVQPDAAQLAQIAALIDAGTLKPTVTTVLPLAEAARAHELSQTGHVRGKIVLQVGG